MDIRPIRTAHDHKAALAEIDALLAVAKLSRSDDARLEVLTVLVSEYEDRTFPLDATDPVHLLNMHMLNSGRTQKDLADLVGRTLASLILGRRRAMSLDVIRRIKEAWGIPSDLLIKPYRLAPSSSRRVAAKAKARTSRSKAPRSQATKSA
jgi:HTH-type transcriptional regulator/antitoxin HigA